METQVSESDVGKRVVYDDHAIGRVVAYQDETAYVEPDPGVADVVRAKLGWETATEDSFPLQRELVGEITDDEIRLQTEM